MNTSNMVRQGVAVALVSLLGGCASWNAMDHQDKATAEGATGGAIVGAVVGGPVGAAVGAGVGGVAANKNADKVPTFSTSTPDRDDSTARAANSNSSTAAPAYDNSGTAAPAYGTSAASTPNAAAGSASNTNAIVNNNDTASSSANNAPSGGEMQSGTVRDAQRALNDKGYSAGTVDGIMGPHTEQALRQFQQAQGLDTSGSLDSQTLSALGLAQ
jgi:hypothetical protein